jgi:regulatory protein
MPRRRAKRITPTYLRRLTGWYLERWDAPAAHLRRKLAERGRRAAEELGQDPAEIEPLLDEAVAWAVAEGLVDDARFARNLVAASRGRGQATPKIRAKLREKGVPAALITAVLAEEAEEAAELGAPDADRVAAIRYARKRRFGPWRPPPRVPEPSEAAARDAARDKRRKELASMARAGFSFGLAATILDGDADALEEELPRGW